MIAPNAEASIASFGFVGVRKSYGLVMGSVRRHRILAISLVLLGTGTGVAAAIFLPRQYSVESQVLTRRDFVMPALTHPKRAITSGSDEPTRAASELILRREALEQIVRKTDLGKKWQQHSPPLMKVKASLRTLIKGPLTPAELDDALVALLKTHLHASVDNDVISIKVRWWNAADALAIVSSAQETYLSEKRRLDVESIEQTVKILSAQVADMHTQLDGRVTDLDGARSRVSQMSIGTAAKPTNGAPDELRAQFFATQRNRMEAEKQRSERIAQLQIMLQQQSATLGERHPDRIATADALAKVSTTDGSQGQMAEERKIKRAYVAAGGRLDDLSENKNPQDRVVRSDKEEDAGIIYAQAMLKVEVDAFADVEARLQDAQIEFSTARAAFGYRYMVVQPPELPKKPDKPNVIIVVLGGIMVGIMMGVVAPAVLDLRRKWRSDNLIRSISVTRSTSESAA